MKRIILFSPKGYVGGYLADRLRKENDVQLYEMTRNSNWNNYKKEDTYDVLIYSAAITSGRNEAVSKYVQDNVMTAVSVIKFCEEHGVKRIIYLSTDEIYGELNTEIVSEKAIMINPNLYASTKYLAEKIIASSQIPYYVLRLPGIVGKKWGKSFLYGLMDRIKRGESIELYNMSKDFNNIVHIDDLVDFILVLCKRIESFASEIFLLGNTEKMKLEEIVLYIKDIYQSTSQIKDIDEKKKRYFILDVSNAIKYGYSSKKIKNIIDELYQIQKD